MFANFSYGSTYCHVLSQLNDYDSTIKVRRNYTPPYGDNYRLVSIRRRLQAWREKFFVSLFRFMRAALATRNTLAIQV